eukprot:UN19920
MTEKNCCLSVLLDNRPTLLQHRIRLYLTHLIRLREGHAALILDLPWSLFLIQVRKRFKYPLT